MILIDKPYVSEFLKKTILEHQLPVVETEIAREIGLKCGSDLLSEKQAVELFDSDNHLKIYTSSENSIGWISKYLGFSDLAEKIDLFKDKVKFRQLLRNLYPDFYFLEIGLEDLDELSLEDIPLPFIIKPVVGFFSMGVHKVSSPDQWDHIVQAIRDEIRTNQALYPPEVLNTSRFILEECVQGEEYAIDAYFNSEGLAVILNIYHHMFSSAEDVSDRVYISSKDIIESNLTEFQTFLQKVGTLSGVRNFPVHVELRRTAKGALIPIEFNPMRFGGWCTTADATFLAYDFNSYLYYFDEKQPDWNAILKTREGKLYSLIVLDNSTGVDGSQITSFDYDRLLEGFEKPVELRKIDYKEYPVFGFLFTETRTQNKGELENILHSDLSEYITAA
jgi:hypothetical protein